MNDWRLRWRALGLGCLLLTAASDSAERLRPKRLAPGRSHFLLRFRDTPGPEARKRLQEAGGRVTARVSEWVWIVSGADEVPRRMAPLAQMSSLHAADKVSPVLAEEAFSAWLVDFHADVAAEDSREVARRAGLEVLEHPDLLPHQLMVTGDAARAARLGEWDEVAYVFPASLDLLVGNRVAGCAGALVEDGIAAAYAKMGSGWAPTGPDGAEIRYFIQNTTAKVARSTAESEIIRAFQEWARYARIAVGQAASGTAPRTIKVLFGRRAHGDEYPFDGQGRVLAHTFYPAPPNREPLAGDMHFDDDEDWHTGSAVDLFTVALHEAGHALGLAHSDRPGAVMYPYYRQAAGLTADDIAGIRALYGNRDATAPPPAGPPPAGFTLTVIEPPATTAAASVALRGAVENAEGQARVTWSNDRGGSGAASGSNPWTIDAVALSPGANIITVRAADQGGHSAWRAVTVTRQSAPAAPPPSTALALRITYPNLSILSTSRPNIAMRGTAAAERVTWTNSTGASGAAAGTAAWSADVPLLVGTNTVTVRAYDAAGNSTWRAVTVVRR